MKSRLVIDPLIGPQVGKFLALRSEGVNRAEAMRRADLSDRNAATMIGVEKNALIYTGHLVWNRRQKQRASREDPHQRMLARGEDEWVMSEEKTHDALITRAQADAVLAIAAVKQKQVRRMKNDHDFLLTGLLYTPDGTPFWCETSSGNYRAGAKGKRISQWLIEEEVINKIHRDSQSQAFRRKLLKAAKAFGAGIVVDVAMIDAEIAERRRQLDNLITLVASGSKAAAARVAELEAEVGRLEQQKADQATAAHVKGKIDQLTEQDMAQWLMSMDLFALRAGVVSQSDKGDPLLDVPEFAEEAEKTNSEARLRVRRWITGLLDRVVFDPSSRLVALHYKWAGGVLLASPRGNNDNPTLASAFSVRRQRRPMRLAAQPHRTN